MRTSRPSRGIADRFKQAYLVFWADSGCFYPLEWVKESAILGNYQILAWAGGMRPAAALAARRVRTGSTALCARPTRVAAEVGRAGL